MAERQAQGVLSQSRLQGCWPSAQHRPALPMPGVLGQGRQGTLEGNCFFSIILGPPSGSQGSGSSTNPSRAPLTDSNLCAWAQELPSDNRTWGRGSFRRCLPVGLLVAASLLAAGQLYCTRTQGAAKPLRRSQNNGTHRAPLGHLTHL